MSALLTHPGTQPAKTQPATPARSGLFRRTWHRIRAAIGEMNYAASRIVEVQAPWTVDGK